MVANTNDLVDELVVRIEASNPMQRTMLQSSLAGLRTDERKRLHRYLEYCEDSGFDIDQLAEAYNTITLDTLREQVYFQRNGRYRYSRFDEVAGHVYHNPLYMRKYMYGLAITAYFWANHREIYRYFEMVIPRRQGGRYLEVGPGHGLFFLQAMALSRYESYEGIDISETSLEMTRSLLSRQEHRDSNRWVLQCGDFLAANELVGPYDAVVIGEVLEHVERPDLFLMRIQSLIRPGGFVFVTTAVNAPAVDHIYLFRTVAEVEHMAITCGLNVVDKLVTGYPGCSIQETEQRRLPINLALVLSA
ncbi:MULTISPECIES: class I SAM-dependent methyltransferase [unclassified Rhodanobacter]|uniref:class I SAM-dependent methyltransferase n=1 Tax=unclassified Rhodanobacter TaxID=2621553 RepID=UPI0009EEB0A3|nr:MULTISPECIES: class I SAM-dependent methyltransferase [unclassified Rhodanobacter]